MVDYVLDNMEEHNPNSLVAGTNVRVQMHFRTADGYSTSNRLDRRINGVTIKYLDSNLVEQTGVYNSQNNVNGLMRLYGAQAGSPTRAAPIIYFPRAHYARISNMIQIKINLTNGDTVTINISKMGIYSLSGSSTWTRRTLEEYLTGRVLAVNTRVLANNESDITYAFSVALSDVFLIIKSIDGLINGNAGDFPHRVVSAATRYQFTGNFGQLQSTNVILSRYPQLSATETISVNSVIEGTVEVPDNTDPETPTTPERPTAEAVRLTVDGATYRESNEKFYVHVEFVPDELINPIRDITIWSSPVDRPNTSNGKSVNARSSDDFYEVIIPDGETRYVYARLRFVDTNTIISQSIVLVRDGTNITISLPDLLEPIIRLFSIFVAKITPESILFRITDDLLLTDKISELRVKYTVDDVPLTAAIENDRQHDYVELVAGGLVASTVFSFEIYAVVNTVEHLIDTIDVSTVMALPENPTPDNKEKQAVAKVICETLPDKEAQELMLLPYDSQLKYVENILSYRTITDGLYFGTDFNKNNASHAYTRKTQSSAYSQDVNVVAKSIVTAEILILPEPHEDIDLTKEPF